MLLLVLHASFPAQVIDRKSRQEVLYEGKDWRAHITPEGLRDGRGRQFRRLVGHSLNSALKLTTRIAASANEVHAQKRRKIGF